MLLAAISLALDWILLPFYGTILWGAISAPLFAPLNRWLLRSMKYWPTLAALLTILTVLVTVVPFALVSVALAREAGQGSTHTCSPASPTRCPTFAGCSTHCQDVDLPCGQVVSATAQKDNDHIATCQNGNCYRVFINARGRVVAEKVKRSW